MTDGIVVDLDGFEPSTSSMPWKRAVVSAESLPGGDLENIGKLAGRSASVVSRDRGSESEKVVSREHQPVSNSFHVDSTAAVRA